MLTKSTPLLLATALALLAPAARAQLFVADACGGRVGEYNLDGTPLNPNLITGLVSPSSLAVIGNILFVYDSGTEALGEYQISVATATAINPALLTVGGDWGTQIPQLAVAGNNLFVQVANADYTTSIGE